MDDFLPGLDGIKNNWDLGELWSRVKKPFSIALLFLLTYKWIQILSTNICHGLDFGGQAAVLEGKPFEGVRGKSRTSDVLFLSLKVSTKTTSCYISGNVAHRLVIPKGTFMDIVSKVMYRSPTPHFELDM